MLKILLDTIFNTIILRAGVRVETFAHLQHLYIQLDGRFDGRRTAAEGLAAIERIARADQIVMVGLAQHQPVGGGERARGAR